MILDFVFFVVVPKGKGRFFDIFPVLFIFTLFAYKKGTWVMFSRKALVDRAIRFRGKSRAPMWLTGNHIKNSDILTYDLSLSDADDSSKSEWGFARKKGDDGFWLVPETATLDQWKDVDAYVAPPIDPVRRFSGIVKAATICEDRYRLATLGLSGFSIYRALRGAEHSAVDCLIEPERFLELMELIFEFETGLFDMIARKGFHGIEFRDDWGDRQTSKMTLSLWRKLLKHRYAAQFRRIKEVGLHIWMSTSAHCGEFFGDLKEIGVDVVRVDSPYNMETATLGRLWRGKLAFSIRLDEMYRDQTIDPEELRQLYDCLSAGGNGFIALCSEKIPARAVEKTVNILRKFSD